VAGEEAAQPSGGSRREQILSCALELFRKQGYDRTSLREISERLGISKSGLYHHFGAKDDLVMSLVGPPLDRINELASGGPGVWGSEELRSFLESYIDTFIENRQVVSLLANDVGVRNHRRINERLTTVNEAIYAHLIGPEPDLAARVRATQVLVGLQGAIVRYAEANPAVVRDVCLRTALAALSA
jgi:AcrR family transcriptional regulator